MLLGEVSLSELKLILTYTTVRIHTIVMNDKIDIGL